MKAFYLSASRAQNVQGMAIVNCYLVITKKLMSISERFLDFCPHASKDFKCRSSVKLIKLVRIFRPVLHNTGKSFPVKPVLRVKRVYAHEGFFFA